jgi:hypothetical protein
VVSERFRRAEAYAAVWEREVKAREREEQDREYASRLERAKQFGPDLDPRWEWIEIREFGGAVFYERVACNHLEVEPVYAGGELVARLCLTCDAQLPAAPPSASPGPCHVGRGWCDKCIDTLM